MKTGHWIALVVVLLCGALAWALYALGGKSQQVNTAQTATKAVVQSEAKAKAQTRKDLARAEATGQARERERAAVDSYFQQLEQESHRAPSAALDTYVLPDDRLRIWRAANAGRPDRDTPASEPYEGSGAATTTAHGSDPRPGSQSPGSGEGLPPVGLADMPAADLPADQTRGL